MKRTIRMYNTKRPPLATLNPPPKPPPRSWWMEAPRFYDQAKAEADRMRVSSIGSKLLSQIH